MISLFKVYSMISIIIDYLECNYKNIILFLFK